MFLSWERREQKNVSTYLDFRFTYCTIVYFSLLCVSFLGAEGEQIFCGGRKNYFVARAHYFLLLFASAIRRRRSFDRDGQTDGQTDRHHLYYTYMTSRGGLRRAGGWPDGTRRWAFSSLLCFCGERERAPGRVLLDPSQAVRENVSTTYLDFRFTYFPVFLSFVCFFLRSGGRTNILWREKKIFCGASSFFALPTNYIQHTPLTSPSLFFAFRRNTMRGRNNETFPLCFSIQ